MCSLGGHSKCASSIGFINAHSRPVGTTAVSAPAPHCNPPVQGGTLIFHCDVYALATVCSSTQTAITLSGACSSPCTSKPAEQYSEEGYGHTDRGPPTGLSSHQHAACSWWSRPFESAGTKRFLVYPTINKGEGSRNAGTPAKAAANSLQHSSIPG